MPLFSYSTLSSVLCTILFTDGVLLAATSSGHPDDPVRCFTVHPDIDDEDNVKMEIRDFPGVAIRSRQGLEKLLTVAISFAFVL